MNWKGKILPGLFLGIGVLIITQVSWPYISYKLWEWEYVKPESLLITPQAGKQEVVGVSIQNTTDNFPSFVSTIRRETTTSLNEFTITIPKLNIIDAKVIVDSNDLSKNLAHLPGSALPGERGNIFISGHSALPILSQGNSYKSIFANLVKLEKGDKIEVLAGNVKFNYQVLGIKIVDPKDLFVINPPDSSGRYISLMTCVPPGLNTKRLVVLGKLI